MVISPSSEVVYVAFRLKWGFINAWKCWRLLLFRSSAGLNFMEKFVMGNDGATRSPARSLDNRKVVFGMGNESSSLTPIVTKPLTNRQSR